MINSLGHSPGLKRKKTNNTKQHKTNETGRSKQAKSVPILAFYHQVYCLGIS